MELVVTAKNLEHLKLLCSKEIDAFVIGNKIISNRIGSEFTKDEIKMAIDIAHQHNKKVYVAMNAIYHNNMIDTIKDYLLFLKETLVDRIMFMDYGFYQTYKDLGLNMELTYASDMMTTNYFLCNYWNNLGVTRSVIANELNLDEIIEIKAKANGQIEMLGQGLLSMFHSVRPLVTRYLEYLDNDSKIVNEDNLQIYDIERDLYYPIYQDDKGTHIMSGREMCVVDVLDTLIENGIDAIRIDGFLQDEEYINQMSDLYIIARSTYFNDKKDYTMKKDYFHHQAETIAKRPLDKGFLYKFTMYKVK